EIYTLSLHDALPISFDHCDPASRRRPRKSGSARAPVGSASALAAAARDVGVGYRRPPAMHTLQSWRRDPVHPKRIAMKKLCFAAAFMLCVSPIAFAADPS